MFVFVNSLESFHYERVPKFSTVAYSKVVRIMANELLLPDLYKDLDDYMCNNILIMSVPDVPIPRPLLCRVEEWRINPLAFTHSE